MRLFTYYAFHTIKNQLKKLFKTWVMVFIVVCMLVGGLIGLGVGMLEDFTDEGEFVEEEYVDEGEATDDEEIIDISIDSSFLGDMNLSKKDIIELVAGAIILLVFVIEAVGADKNGSSIFVPADVNLLFASPMKPQSVLMFRLMTNIGTLVIVSAYMLFQLPNLVLNLGVSVWTGLAFVAAWGFTLIMGKLLQMFLYTVAATYPKVKANLRKGIFGVIALIAAAYFVFWKTSGVNQAEAAALFFNAKVSRYIPVWGWIKGFCMSAYESNIAAMLIYTAVIVVFAVVLVYFIWNIKADFYEDAMAKSEEMAELLEKAQSEKSNGLVLAKRKKDRSEKLRRDGMSHGWGANVFFFKTIYNRFRFAHFGVLTKTSETYLVAVIGVVLLCKLVLKVDAMIPAALTLAGFAFYRSLGNPLEEDVNMDCFRMIPESPWAKLFWSLLGGSVNCLLDVLPAMVVAVIVTLSNPLAAVAWIIFIVSIDFYATNVGAFIDLSVPVSAGKMIKQLVQIMFIYFGLLPDIIIVVLGFVFGQVALAIACAGIINIMLGFVFFALTPVFLTPKGGR